MNGRPNLRETDPWQTVSVNQAVGSPLASAPSEKLEGSRRSCGARGKDNRPDWEMLSNNSAPGENIPLEMQTGPGGEPLPASSHTGRRQRDRAMGEADAGIGTGERRAAWSQGLGELGAQESFNSGVDVPSCGNQGLQVGLPVDETHGVKLLQLLLESHFWRLHL